MPTAKQLRKLVRDARGNIEQIGLYLDDINDAADDAEAMDITGAVEWLQQAVARLGHAEDECKDAAEILTDDEEADDDDEEEEP